MNESIKLYIEAQFSKLPSAPEFERAKAELLQMSEDKYAELTAAGMSDSEATGRVITEFGNLDELAGSLGIRSAMPVSGVTEIGDELEIYSPEKADAAFARQKKSSLMVALGVAIILLGVLVNALLEIDGGISFSASEEGSYFSLTTGFPVILGAVIAVPIFIMASGSNKIFRKLNEGKAAVDYDTANAYKARIEAGEKRYHAGIALGVGLILIGVLVSTLGSVASIGVLVAVLLGVPVLVANGGARTAVRVLAESGPQTANKRLARGEFENKMAVFSAIFWPVVVALYLLISFLADAWQISWIIWPVAGILFTSLVVAIESSVNKKHGIQRG